MFCGDLFYNIIKTIPSDAESCEDQNGGKQKIVQGTMAEIRVIFHQGAVKNTKINEKLKM